MSPVIRNGRRERAEYAVGLVGSPPSPVVRREAAEGERAGFAPRMTQPGLIRLPRRDPAAEARRIATERALAQRLAEPVTSSEESSAMPKATPPPDELQLIVTTGDVLDALQIALSEARDAWTTLQEARVAETRWAAATKALESAWARTGLRGGPTSIDTAIEALKLGVELGRADVADPGAGEPEDDAPPTLASPAAHFHEAEPERAAVASGGGPGRGTTKQDRILASVGRLGGDLKAIAEANRTTTGNVNATLHNAGKRRRLTADMIAVLPAVFAKYSGA